MNVAAYLFSHCVAPPDSVSNKDDEEKNVNATTPSPSLSLSLPLSLSPSLFSPSSVFLLVQFLQMSTIFIIFYTFCMYFS